MKTTVELPDTTFRQAKAVAAGRGISLKQFFTEALEEQLRRCTNETSGQAAEAPWMAGFGVLSDLSGENQRVLKAIESEFETLDPQDLT